MKIYPKPVYYEILQDIQKKLNTNEKPPDIIIIGNRSARLGKYDDKFLCRIKN